MVMVGVREPLAAAALFESTVIVSTWWVVQKKSAQPMPEAGQPARVCGTCTTIKEEIE